jgi:signal transduction histidine kinase
MTSHLAEELRTTFLFEQLTDDQLDWLVARGDVCTYDRGAHVYEEGAPGAHFYVLLDGGVRFTRRVGADVVELPETTQRGVYAGATQSIIGSGGDTYLNSLLTTRPSRFFRLPTGDYAAFLQRWFPMAVHLLEGLLVGVRNSEAMIRQHEQLTALGALSAGLAHELNNPSSAAMRATGQLRDRVAGMRHKLAMLADGRLSGDDLGELVAAQERVVDLAAKAPRRSALAESEAEDALADWLDDHEVAGSWEIAAVFATAGIEPTWLTELAEQVGPARIEPALRWLMYTLETETLMTEIEEATGRISTLVTAVKQYSHMDRAPIADVDVTEGIDSTLTLLGHKLATIDVRRDYADDLAVVLGHTGELNQVWTNLIDNAAQAMDGAGELTVAAHPRDGGVEVVVRDTGPGIPDDIRPHVFEAFFTTKPAGEGSGLGLEIAHRIVTQRHRGTITVDSSPDGTAMRVWLPGGPDGPTPAPAAGTG